ncbi:hypothetical protein ANCDUO_12293 [Ancylostoma duodenale]|uniref:Uncharacterized protein n=1 Tax=Ancylostoma duodenale TaxID=51022 RepID=A0A0C2D5Y2_9BILA|nr:hypothetical protein ANCDUO_12293 [Ancylostoma duodenale]
MCAHPLKPVRFMSDYEAVLTNDQYSIKVTETVRLEQASGRPVGPAVYKTLGVDPIQGKPPSHYRPCTIAKETATQASALSASNLNPRTRDFFKRIL